jgi:hypothetical protein
VLDEAYDAFLAVLDRYTLADLMREKSALIQLLETREAPPLILSGAGRKAKRIAPSMA